MAWYDERKSATSNVRYSVQKLKDRNGEPERGGGGGVLNGTLKK
jgi:hypothetical protein